MTRKPTQIGLAAPAQTNKRPSGRYKVSAPDAPVGSVLRVTCGSDVAFVQVVAPNEKRLFVDLDGREIVFADWDYASRQEVSVFKFRRRVKQLADIADSRGAPTFALTVRNTSDAERALIIDAVAEELIASGRPGKASQLRAFLDGGGV
jgi:hypothetical protein